jgi:hypothetical protein
MSNEKLEHLELRELTSYWRMSLSLSITQLEWIYFRAVAFGSDFLEICL